MSNIKEYDLIQPRPFIETLLQKAGNFEIQLEKLVDKHFTNENGQVERLPVDKLYRFTREVIEKAFFHTVDLYNSRAAEFLRVAIEELRMEVDLGASEEEIFVDGFVGPITLREYLKFLEGVCQFQSLSEMLTAFLVDPSFTNDGDAMSLDRDTLKSGIASIIGAFLLYFGEKYNDDCGGCGYQVSVLTFNKLALNLLRNGSSDTLESAISEIENLLEPNGGLPDIKRALTPLWQRYKNIGGTVQPQEVVNFFDDTTKSFLCVNLLTLHEAYRYLIVLAEKLPAELYPIVEFGVKGLVERYTSEIARLQRPYRPLFDSIALELYKRNQEEFFEEFEEDKDKEHDSTRRKPMRSLVDLRRMSILTNDTFAAQVAAIMAADPQKPDLSHEEIELILETFDQATELIGLYNDIGGLADGDVNEVFRELEAMVRNHPDLTLRELFEFISQEIESSGVTQRDGAIGFTPEVERRLFTVLKDAKQEELNILLDGVQAMSKIPGYDQWALFKRYASELKERIEDLDERFKMNVIRIMPIYPYIAYLVAGFVKFNKDAYLSGFDYDLTDEGRGALFLDSLSSHVTKFQVFLRMINEK